MEKEYKRPSWVKYYKTAAWARLRLWQLKREPLCRFCKRKGIVTEAKVVDHITAHKGNTELFFSKYNLQSLCSHCHESTKKRIENSGNFGCDESGIVEAWK